MGAFADGLIRGLGIADSASSVFVQSANRELKRFNSVVLLSIYSHSITLQLLSNTQNSVIRTHKQGKWPDLVLCQLSPVPSLKHSRRKE